MVCCWAAGIQKSGDMDGWESLDLSFGVSTVQVKVIRCRLLYSRWRKHCKARRRLLTYLGRSTTAYKKTDPQSLYPILILVLNSTSSTSHWWRGLSANMSASSRTVPQEQLPSQDLHPRPMPVINLGHLSLDSATRSSVVNEITKACRDVGYFQVCFLMTVLPFFGPFFRFSFPWVFPCLNLMLDIATCELRHSLPRKLVSEKEKKTDASTHILVKATVRYTTWTLQALASNIHWSPAASSTVCRC
jgi:hypothetical protein